MAAKGDREALPDEDMPGYVQFVTDVYESASNYFEKMEDRDYASWPAKFYHDLGEHCEISFKDMAVVFFLAVIWTISRSYATRNIYLPMADHFKLTPLNREKFPESAWKSLFYTFTWSYTVYIVFFSGKYDFFHRPNHLWEDFQAYEDVPTDIYIAYAIQFSFYLHSVYGTIFLDRWRKDSLVMIFHHFLTMALLGFSYASRYHKIGMLVLLVHDISDVFLEYTKCNVYFKERAGKIYPIHEHLSTIGFIGFASSWYYCRLYLFPLKVLYSAGYGVKYAPGDVVPFYFFFNVLLWILQALNIYWFMFILNLLVKVALGQMNEVDDVREEEVVRKHSSVSLKKRNGDVLHEYEKDGETYYVVENNHVTENHNGDKHVTYNGDSPSEVPQTNGYAQNGHVNSIHTKAE